MSTSTTFKIRGTTRRILVLRPRALGDVLLMTPALRALRAGFPESELDVAVDEVLEPLLRRNPHLDRLWLFPRRQSGRLRKWLALYRGILGRRYDLVVDLHGSPRTALLAYMTRAPNRVGYALRGRGRLYNLHVPRDSDREGRRRMLYAAQVNLEIVARCVAESPQLLNTQLVFVPDKAIEELMAAELRGSLPGRPRVGIAPAGTWQAKTAPPEFFARAADLLVDAGCQVMVLWGPGERPVAEEVLSKMQAVAHLAPATNIDQLAALLAQLDVVLCNDSGVKHLAVARGTSTVTVFGPTNPGAWMPPHGPHAYAQAAVPCLGCNFTSCLHHLCMRLLEPELVTSRVIELLRVRHNDAGIP